jgi:alpha-amylase
MASVCFYFQVHQPTRLRHYTVFDNHPYYFDDHKNGEICRKVANKCYLPMNRLILELINRYDGRFKVAYSITGVLLEQLFTYAPEVVSTFDALARTGCIEFLAETYYHSLSFLYSRNEFVAQVNKHTEMIQKHFGQTPRIFRNTELIYNNDLAALIESMGRFDAVLCEGVDRLRLLLKNYTLSDDIAFRFSNRDWSQWPLTADKFGHWISKVNGNGFVVNLFMDYETFGEHQWKETGIFDFMKQLPEEVFRHPDNDFKTPSEVVKAYPPVGVIDVPHLISWADIERDLSAWLGNAMQSNAIHELYRLEKKIRTIDDQSIINDWRKMQTSDHFYYMCTKWFSDGDVHKYFNPYDSPYDSYINFMNILGNLQNRCAGCPPKQTITQMPKPAVTQTVTPASLPTS